MPNPDDWHRPCAADWYEALASEVGIVKETDDPYSCRMEAYKVRKELQDPDLNCISVMQGRDNAKEVWLVKRKQNDTSQGDLRTPEGDSEPSKG